MTILQLKAKALKQWQDNPTKENLDRLHQANLAILNSIHHSIVNPFTL